MHPIDWMNDNSSEYEKPTEKQQTLLKWLTAQLLDAYSLQRTDVYRHPQVSRKNEGRPGMPSDRQTAWIALLLAFPCAAPASRRAKHLQLPGNAVVKVGQKTLGNSVSDAEMCKSYAVSPREVRRYFATYRLIDPQEKHYLYQQVACSIEGTVTVHGKSFPWIANPGGTLGTTYPDGVQKDLGTTDPAMLDTSQ